MGPAEISAHPVALGECHLVMFDFISCCARGCEEGTGKFRDCEGVRRGARADAGSGAASVQSSL